MGLRRDIELVIRTQFKVWPRAGGIDDQDDQFVDALMLFLRLIAAHETPEVPQWAKDAVLNQWVHAEHG
ncbi:MAG: hypothetical protein WCZ87_00340 [Thiohalobacteraceae bacterium]